MYLPCPLLRCHFFFYFDGDPPDLHSFPTRRSSDLSLEGKTLIDASSGNLGTAVAMVGASYGVKVRLLVSKDRKSTRLNSSHRCISYAVFCLKKKKRMQTDMHQSRGRAEPNAVPDPR